MKHYFSMLLILFTTVLFSQNKSNYNIGMLIDILTPEIEPLIKELQNEITAVVGEDATVTFPPENILSNNFDLQTAAINYNTLLSNNTDIILAFGKISSMLIFKQSSHSKPTILFGAINEDFSPIKEENKSSGIRNFTYLVIPQSFKKDLKAFKELCNFNKVGIAVEEALLTDLSFKETLEKDVLELGITYKITPFESTNDIIGAINSDIDAFYLAGGFFLGKEEIQQIADKLIKEKIPSFTSTDSDDVVLGMMATNQSVENLSQFFRRIALNVEAYVNGTNLSELPIYIQSKDKLTINYNTAESVGMPIKYSLLANTNFVGDFNNVLSQKKYSLLDVMNDVLNKNLSLASGKKNIDLSKQDIKTAKSEYYPDISASTTGTYIDPDLAEISNGENPEFSTSGDITLSQLIFSESARANIDIQKNLLSAQEESYNVDELDAIFDAANIYFNALILKANLQIQKENLDLTRKNLEIAEQKFEAGKTGKSDVLRFTSEQAQNTQSLIEAANDLEQIYFSLNQLLNNPIDYEIDVDEAELGEGIFENYDYQQLRNIIDDPKLRKSFVEYLVVKAKENAPELKSLDYNLMAVERNINLNGKGRYYPTLSLQGNYNRDFFRWGKGRFPESPLKDNYNLSLNLSMPIFQQNQKNINKQTSIIEKKQLIIDQANVSLNIEVNVQNAILNIINEISNIETSKISESSARESLDLTQNAYANGSVTIVDLLDSQNNLLSAQLSKANAIYNYLLNSLQLERYVGHFFLLKTPAQNQEFIEAFFSFFQNKN